MSWRNRAEHPCELSISDDDLCSDCQHLVYRPGDESRCRWNWPFDEVPGTDYVRTCGDFIPIANWGDNIPLNSFPRPQ